MWKMFEFRAIWALGQFATLARCLLRGGIVPAGEESIGFSQFRRVRRPCSFAESAGRKFVGVSVRMAVLYLLLGGQEPAQPATGAGA